MAKSLDKKRVLTMAGLGSAAVLVTGLIMFSATQQGGGSANQNSEDADNQLEAVGSGVFSQATRPDDIEGDPVEGTPATSEDFEDIAVMSAERLEALREKEQEMTELYDGAPQGQYLGELEDGDVIYSNIGQLSNFDERETDLGSYSSIDSDESNSFDDGPANVNATEEEAGEPSAVEDSEIGEVFGNAPVQPVGELRNDGLTEAELNHLLATTSASPVAPAAAPADESSNVLVQLEEMDAQVTKLSQAVANLEARPQTSAVDHRNIQGIESSITATQVEVRALRERLDTFNEATSLSADDVEQLVEMRLSEALESSLVEMSSEIEARLSEKLTSQPQAAAAAPSRPNVSNLYEMLSIEGNAVVLRGLNTGRTFRLGEGDSLAYGGTLERIQGDRAVLRWPHQTITLHVFN